MYAKYFKRMLDFILSLIALIILSPLLLIVAIFVRIKLGSPIIFKQQRPGKNEKIFTLYKFRTMTDNKDENGNLLPDSERLTKFGKILRSTSLDELPELVNILKGDMSLVGTRPPTVEEFENYDLKHKARLGIKPGLTGMWQVSGRSDIKDFEEVVGLDTYYIAHWDLGLDIKILLKTIKVVVTGRGSE